MNSTIEFSENTNDGKIAKFLNKRPTLQLIVMVVIYPLLIVLLTIQASFRFIRAMWIGFKEACMEFVVFRDLIVYNRAVKYCYDKVRIRHIVRR